VALARDGQHGAFDELYHRHVRSVSRVVSSVLATPEDRADAVQETFIQAFARLHDLRAPDQFRSWLLSIGKNEARAAVRRAQRRPVVVSEIDPDEHSVEPGPVDLAELGDLAARLGVARATLSARAATALTLTVALGLSPSELALALGVSDANAKVILHRARKHLRRSLADSGWDTTRPLDLHS